MGSKTLITAVAIVAVASCSAPKVLHDYQRDSIIVQIRDSIFFHDTVILASIPAESGQNNIPDSDTSFLQTSLAESSAYVADGQLHHTLRNKSDALIPIEVKIPVRIHYEQKGLVRYLKTVEKVEVEKELSRWQSFIMKLGYALLIAGIAWLAYKLAKILI